MPSNETNTLHIQGNQLNILIIVADDLGWNDVSYHNAPFKTPSIDRIAKEGVELDRFYTPPLCTPCRAALLTGRDPIKLGLAYSTIMPWDNFGLAPQEHLMPQSFQQAGYQTAMIGKWHLGHTIRAHHPNRRGFDYFWGHLHTDIDYFKHGIAGGHDLQINGESIHEDGKYETFLAAQKVVDWLKSRDRSRPFFLYSPFIAPHSPLQAPEDLIDKYSYIGDERRRVYAAMVDALDQGVGRILDALEEEGIADNTIVLFFSDNGGSQFMGGDNSPLRGWKGQAFEGGIRVPAALRWPARIQGGRKVTQVISVLDMFPTLAAMTGVKPQNKKPLEGKNVRTSIENDESFERDDSLFFISDSPLTNLTHVGVIHKDHKLVLIIDQLQTTTTIETYLFDLKKDPLEQNDLADQYPELVADFAARIKEWRSQHPIAGVHCHIVPHPGWRGPLDWAEAMAAYDGIIDEECEVHFMGRDPKILETLDRWYGERGRLIYK